MHLLSYVFFTDLSGDFDQFVANRYLCERTAIKKRKLTEAIYYSEAN